MDKPETTSMLATGEFLLFKLLIVLPTSGKRDEYAFFSKLSTCLQIDGKMERLLKFRETEI